MVCTHIPQPWCRAIVLSRSPIPQTPRGGPVIEFRPERSRRTSAPRPAPKTVPGQNGPIRLPLHRTSGQNRRIRSTHLRVPDRTVRRRSQRPHPPRRPERHRLVTPNRSVCEPQSRHAQPPRAPKTPHDLSRLRDTETLSGLPLPPRLLLAAPGTDCHARVLRLAPRRPPIHRLSVSTRRRPVRQSGHPSLPHARTPSANPTPTTPATRNPARRFIVTRAAHVVLSHAAHVVRLDRPPLRATVRPQTLGFGSPSIPSAGSPTLRSS